MAVVTGHELIVWRQFTGTSPAGGRRYATNARCSCGVVPNVRRASHSTRITNTAPSAGGRVLARQWHARHLAEVRYPEAARILMPGRPGDCS